MLVKLTEVRFENEKWVVSSGKEATKEKVLSQVSNNVLLKASLSKLLLDTGSSEQETTRDMYFRMLW